MTAPYSEAFDGEWNHNSIAIRAEWPPPVPSPEEWEADVRNRRERAHTALQLATDALARLRRLSGALGAVARLHVPRGGEFDRWGCDGCEACCDTVDWPCSTIITIAEELDIKLPNYYDLPRGDLEPLDAPIPPLPTHWLEPVDGTDYFLRLPRPESFVTLSTILDPD